MSPRGRGPSPSPLARSRSERPRSEDGYGSSGIRRARPSSSRSPCRPGREGMSRAVPRPIRVLIVDDHEVIRAGLRMLIESHPVLAVAGEAGTCAEALAAAGRDQPEIILLDLDLSGEQATECIPELLAAARGAHVLVLTGVRDPALHRRAVRLGAMGVVRKEKAAAVLLEAIDKVHAGEAWLERALVV